MFRLMKWYLDCVTNEGDAAIFYWASLAWGAWHVDHGAALLRASPDGPVGRYTLRPGRPPAIADDRGTWECPAIDAGGTWTFVDRTLERTLLDCPRGTVKWHCASPRAQALVHVGNRTLRGLGYVECLALTGAPWHLPIERLRWGRFHSPDRTVVWIDWRGPLSRSWVFANGVESPGAEVSATHLHFPATGAHLTLEEGRILRSGRLCQTALSSLRALTVVVPRWRHAFEEKRVSRGALMEPGGLSGGWAIHEEVVWPRRRTR